MRKTIIFFTVAMIAALWATSAQAAFPGQNGKIVGEVTDNLGAPDSSWYVFLLPPETDKFGPAENFNPSVSPDGQKILWTCTELGYLCTYNLDGSGSATIYPHNDRLLRRASYSPDGTKIVFEGASDISVMDADGTGVVDLGVQGSWPEWSPDGKKIAYVGYSGFNNEIYTINADGTGQFRVTSGTSNALTPSWAPDGTKIAFARNSGIYVVRPDGSGETQLTTTPNTDGRPAWAPDGTKIAFTSTRDQQPIDPDFPPGYVAEVYTMNADGTSQTRVTYAGQDPITPHWSYGVTDWQPIPINGYPRPKGASPLRVSLVPAANQCTAPNRTHGAPLSFGSCAPPGLTSQYLTTGSPDANGRGALMNAYLTLTVVPGIPSTTTDEADVQIRTRLNDVFKKDLTDYSGTLHARIAIRIIDKDNTPSPGGPGAGTTVPFPFAFEIPCTPDPATNVGSDCQLQTTADTLIPGAVKETRRTIWQSVGPLKIDDGGADADGSTTADNTLFATQGVFVP